MSANEFDFLEIETIVLKVHLNCQGCKNKVRKLLRKIEGVYKVSIDAEEQKVTVLGSVDSEALINKLIRAGKYAELWSPSFNNQSQNLDQADFRNYGNNNMQVLINGPGTPNGQYMYPSSAFLGSEVSDDWGSETYLYQNPGIHTGFQGEGAGSVGFGRQGFGGSQDFSASFPANEYHHPPSMMLNNGQGYQYIYPSTEMMNNSYMHDRHSGMMLNDYMCVHQPQMMKNHISPLVPTNNGYFSYAPHLVPTNNGYFSYAPPHSY